jgi:hypothetical protein
MVRLGRPAPFSALGIPSELLVIGAAGVETVRTAFGKRAAFDGRGWGGVAHRVKGRDIVTSRILPGFFSKKAVTQVVT